MCSVSSRDADRHVIRVRPQETTDTRQGLPYFLGICETTSHARRLSLNLVIVPPGASAEPHFHDGFETAIYQLEGRVETRYGPRLEHSVVTETGDFLFIPPGVPHQALNLSTTERAVGLVARNDSSEQENVVLYDPLTSQRTH
jgi:uncharacterized RmlC-like cupin family protein